MRQTASLLIALLAGSALSLAAAAADKPLAKPEDTALNEKEPKKPEEVVDVAVQKVLAILADPRYREEAKKAERRGKIREILLGVVDMPTVGELTLARHKKDFSKEQFDEFIDLFSRLLFSTYISHLEKYSGEKVVTLRVRDMGTRSSRVQRVEVQTEAVSDTKKIPINYRMITKGGHWKLYDVYVEGVSLVLNYRTQFGEILRTKPAAELLKRMAEKVRENEKNL